jgi:hypothetical protein
MVVGAGHARPSVRRGVIIDQQDGSAQRSDVEYLLNTPLRLTGVFADEHRRVESVKGPAELPRERLRGREEARTAHVSEHEHGGTTQVPLVPDEVRRVFERQVRAMNGIKRLIRERHRSSRLYIVITVLT